MTHQRISKKIIIYLFIFFTLTTVTNTKLSSDFYKIRKFNIIGLNNQESKKIYDDLKIFKNSNIFFFDKKKITEKIYLNEIVEQLEVFKSYPSTLNIEIKKTNFFAVMKKENGNYLIGSNGNLLKIDNANSELPFIFGNVAVKDFLYFKKLIDNSNFEFNEIKNLYYFKSNRWDVITKDKLTLKMPPNLTLEKLNLIFTVIKSNDFNDEKIIDFRQSNMIVVNE